MSDEQYFSRAERGCTDCPTRGRFGILAGVVVALAGTGLVLYRTLARAEAWGRLRARLDICESQVGVQPPLSPCTASSPAVDFLPIIEWE